MEIRDEMVNVNFSQEGNRLVSKIEFANDEIDSKDFQYAFYLLLDDVRLETRGYTKENFAEFLPVCNGKYTSVGFVKYGENKIIKRSNAVDFEFDENIETDIDIKEKVSVSIFGSCVSRDIFNFDMRNKFRIKTYVARQSVVSALSEPVPCNANDINLSSKFQKKAVYEDFAKETFEKFKQDNSDYLVIDFIDERFKLIKYDNNGIDSFLTYSASLDESGYIKKPNFVSRKRKLMPWRDYYIDDKKLSSYMDLFCEKILDIFPSEKIIINRGKMLNFYKNKSGNIVRFSLPYLKNNRDVNNLLDYMYDYIEGRFSKCYVLDFCDDYCADEEHIWGLAPMHYQKEYYERALSEIAKITMGGV
ncbi:MAG: hypothetical protein HFE62_00945 [Firmicutes bacterium]|nr:hypothetical protein [Bacillota bacterium]